MKVLSVLLLALLFAACGDNAVKNDEPETTPPTVAFDAATLDKGGDTLVVDTLTLKGTASDASGIDEVSVQIQGGDTTYRIVPAGSEWSVRAGLLPGVNRITVTAKDEVNNTATATLTVYYRTNYLPIDNTSSWIFKRGGDTLRIICDSANGTPIKYFRLKFVNQDDLVADTLLMALDTVKGTMGLGHSDYQALTAPALFLREFPKHDTTLSHASVKFLGDMAIADASVPPVSVLYRNVVKVTVTDTTKQIVYIRDYYLAPYKGFVGITTRFDRPFGLSSTVHPAQ